MLILLIDIDIVESIDDNVVKCGVIDGLFSDLTLLFVDDVDWVNEAVWEEVIINDLIEVIILGTTDVVVNSSRYLVLCIAVVWVNEVEL